MSRKPHLTLVEADVENFAAFGTTQKLRADVSVFSPPYKKKEGYSQDLMHATGRLLNRVLEPGSWVFMNFGIVEKDFFRPWEARAALGYGAAAEGNEYWLRSWQPIVWVKSTVIDGVQRGHYTPINAKAQVLNYCFGQVVAHVRHALGA